ncbi:cytochrome p450 [Moniliophthora roreri MCA 2997]|uniref:Cytochrome p450 n=2 Tax=Moniliophthora roreri TaxID=221103 RepID=V2Z1M3_MONRO|nr:cytochrome p450 [Moniliophthora roreri MCA 2997]KAI3602519.1 cytochrome p450 [Moniliophthora roreri]
MIIPLLVLQTHDAYQALSIALIILCLALFARLIKSGARGRRIPGPPGLPLLGNLLQLGGGTNWVTFTEWKKEYGDIVYINIAGQDAVILNSRKVATDLLDRRGVIYSDRPQNIVAQVLTGGMVFAFSQHNDVWKRMRRAAAEAMSNSAMKKYSELQETEAVLLVGDILRDPSNWDAHLQRAANSLVLAAVYGMPPIRDHHSPDIARVNRYVEMCLHACAPGSFLVEYFTWMQYLPRWISPWRRYAEDNYNDHNVFFEKLYNDVKQRIAQGDERPSVASSIHHDEKHFGVTGREAAWLSATLYAGASGTTSGQLSWFVLAMVLHPEVQKRAQDEIDRVVGRGRMPTVRDFDQLFYVRAVVKELLRWRPVGPLGVPHRLDEDDIYEGYYLKKDTMIITNIWAMNHDPETYGQDADNFVPERHLDERGVFKASNDTKDEGHHTFGFGRRVCVGRHLSKSSLFISTACILWAFNITPGEDQHGNTIIPDANGGITDGLLVRPPDFPCSITPRYPDVPNLLAQVKELHGFAADA